VPRARSKQEYLEGLRRGLGKVRGETGSYYKLTRDVLCIAREMMRRNPWTLPLAPLAVGVPLVILGNYAIENVFARLWMARYLHARSVKSAAGTIAEVVA
jgi:hypothetical protein